jgi:uncharacterized protein involved in exopolysaccharide biosynthesis
MEETGTAPPITDDHEISLLDLSLVLTEHFRLLVLIPIAAGLVALGISFLFPPTFTAVARILPPVQQQSTSALLATQLGSLAGLLGGATGIKSPADQYVALLKSYTVYDAIIQRFSLRERYGERYIEDVRKELDRRTTISAGSKDGMISIEAEDRDPRIAADIANGFVSELQRLSQTLAISEAAQRRLFFERQLQQAKNDLTNAETALRVSGVGEAVLKTVPQTALEIVARLKAQVTAQEIKMSSLRTFMTDSNPELRLAAQELLALQAELAKAEGSDVPKAAGAGVEYVSKYRDFKYQEALFELMAKQYELARLDEAREGAVIQVVDVALLPEKRSGPKRAFAAGLTTVVGLLVMSLFVSVRRAFRRAGREPLSADKVARLRSLLRKRS